MSNWWESAPADPWEKKEEDPWAEKKEEDNSWGEQKWENKEEQQQSPPAHDFWDTQKWNKESGILSTKEDWEVEALFTLQGRAQAGLNFAKYDQVPVETSGEKVDKIPICKTFTEIYEKFQSLIPEALKENLQKVRYDTPTPVQKFAVPCGLVGRDIMCCAQTGSGKTAAFLIPVIGRMMNNHVNPVGSLTEPFEGPCFPDTLVMTPTRELCIQIYEEAQKFCHGTPYRVSRIYGGAKPKIQLTEIAKGTDLMVATPGRLQDFINRGVVKMSGIHVLVLDEADRMLDMGFESQVREIVEQHDMPGKDARQTMMFSATFPETCQKMAMDFLYNHVWIAVGVIGSAVETVQQTLKKVTPASKFEELLAVLDDFALREDKSQRLLVFVNAKDTAKWLDEQLWDKKFQTGALHGNLEQQERETNLERFRTGQIDIMVATDVAARGLDIENVAIVINYDLPRDLDTYIHRIGRTGRIGNDGKAITYLSCDDNDVCLEAVDLLKGLVDVLKGSKADIPDWMQPLIDSTEASKGGGWSWGGKDAREGQETNTWTGGGDTWSSWQADSAGDKGDTKWEEQKEAPAATGDTWSGNTGWEEQKW